MTSWGQEITQPAHPVHSPVVMTSSYSSFHWSVQRSRPAGGAVSGLAGAGAASVVDMAGSLGGYATWHRSRWETLAVSATVGCTSPTSL